MADETSRLYREEALQHISSPEQLTDYLKVTNPGIWTLLIALILLLGGLLAWSTVGELETLAHGKATVHGGIAKIVLTDTAGYVPASGMTVRIGSQEDIITSVEDDAAGSTVSYASVDVDDGTYDVTVVVERIHPIRFLFD